MISHYRILEKLGDGGVGVVHVAENTRPQRTVPLKSLPVNLTSDVSSMKAGRRAP